MSKRKRCSNKSHRDADELIRDMKRIIYQNLEAILADERWNKLEVEERIHIASRVVIKDISERLGISKMAALDILLWTKFMDDWKQVKVIMKDIENSPDIIEMKKALEEKQK